MPKERIQMLGICRRDQGFWGRRRPGGCEAWEGGRSREQRPGRMGCTSTRPVHQVA